jgi:hypothetical protein
MALTDAEIGELKCAAFVHAMAGFHAPPRYPAFIPGHWPEKEYWPVPCRAYVFEMIRRTYGMAGVEYARTLPLLRRH